MLSQGNLGSGSVQNFLFPGMGSGDKYGVPGMVTGRETRVPDLNRVTNTVPGVRPWATNKGLLAESYCVMLNALCECVC